MLLTVGLFIPCVTLCCCLCRTALLYLGQVTDVNENLFSTGLPGEIKNNVKIKMGNSAKHNNKPFTTQAHNSVTKLQESNL